MADIKAITGLDGTIYNFRDDYSVWGGNNYLTNSKNEVTGTVPSSSYSDFKVWSNVVTVNPNDVWTLSFDAKASLDGTKMISYLYNNTSGIVQCSSVLNSQGITGTGRDGNSTLTLTTEYQRYWITWTFNDGPAALKTCIAGRLTAANNTAGTTATLQRIKLEKGHKATDWSPCYKDIFSYDSTNNQLIVNL